ncbi:MAG: aminopeptidase [Bacteroidales bacterium]|nr:aminopeptidase [Bacteroidales bacterium]
MLKRSLLSTTLVALIFLFFSVNAQQENENEKKKGYIFTDEIRLAATPVKNQYRSGTCWSFGTNSLIESELLRIGKGEISLSEMFVVYNTYSAKVDRYVRFHGSISFSGGGALPDAFYVLENFGAVPDEAYSGKVIGEKNHVHGEMDAVLKAFADAVIKNPNRKLTPVWKEGYNSLLDVYLGSYPKEFTYKGKNYTPKSFAASLGIKTEDYVQLASFTHHPFYKDFIIEVPDNWNFEKAWNLPLNEFMEVIDEALTAGYTVAWASDISERGFSHRNGVAIVPETEFQVMDGMERGRWEQLSQKEKDDMLYSFKEPIQEKKITQEERQAGYDNQTTTDDHAMHIIGIASDQKGAKYYIVKNSWGTDNNPYGGYLYASEAFVQYKTISIMLNKNAIPQKIKSKLGL